MIRNYNFIDLLHYYYIIIVRNNNPFYNPYLNNVKINYHIPYLRYCLVFSILTQNVYDI